MFLVLCILILQIIYVFISFEKQETTVAFNQEKYIALQQQIDSVKLAKKNKTKPKLYPFNPNYITDYKGYQLGMSLEEIDRLHTFRKQRKFVNSKEEFQAVTKISDTLLHRIAPYFKFPDWVIQKNKKRKAKQKFIEKQKQEVVEKPIPSITHGDINKVTIEELASIGVDVELAKRIIKYRSILQGFTWESQLEEVWGIRDKDRVKIAEYCAVKQKPVIKKLNINETPFKKILKIPYIDYELCKKIFDYKEEVSEIQDINELKKISNFPLKKYDRIILYLEAK